MTGLARLAPVLALGGILGCAARAADTTAPRTAAVTRARFEQRVLLTCELRAVNVAAVSAPRGLAGRASFTIAEMVAEGTRVKPGDVVLRFDGGEIQQSKVQRETELVTAQNDIEIKRLQASANEAELRAKIAEAEASLSKAEIDASLEGAFVAASKLKEYRNAAEQARVELGRQRVALTAATSEAGADEKMLAIQQETAKSGLDQAEASLAAFVVTATRAGIVVQGEDWNDRKYRVGDSVYSGTTVLTIQDLSAIEASCALDQADRHLVREGMPVELQVDARPTTPFSGQVASLAPFAESPGRGWWRRSDVRIFHMKVAIEKPDSDLMKPGLSARAAVLVRDEAGLTLPRAALLSDAQGPFVLAAGKRVPVELSARNATTVLLASGVKEGDVFDLPETAK